MVYKKIIASTNDVFSGRQVRIHGILLRAGSTAATTKLEDAVTAGTNDFYYSPSVPIDGAIDHSWGSEGITVNYVSVTLTGTGPILYLYYS